MMKRDAESLTNPPECNQKLNDLLVAQPERSIANDKLRQQLETVSGDQLAFKLKNPNEVMLKALKTFDQLSLDQHGSINVV